MTAGARSEGTEATHYDVLGVASSARPEVLRAAYLALAKLYHPDGASPDEERMKAINGAWEVLRDEVSRAAYDADLDRTVRSARPASRAETWRRARRPGHDDDSYDDWPLGEDGWGDGPAGPAGDDGADDRPMGEDGWGDGWGDEAGRGGNGDSDDAEDAAWGEEVVDPPSRRSWPWTPPRSSDPTAVVGRRVVAFVLDAAVIYLLAMVAIRIAGFFEFNRIRAAEGGDPKDVCEFLSASVCVTVGDSAYIPDGSHDWTVYALCWLVPAVLVHAVVQGQTGLTPGKALVGVRTVRADGLPPGVLRAVVRMALLVVDALPYCLPALGLSLMGTNAGHRRAGDVAAGTFVVRRRAAGRPLVVPGMVMVRRRARRW